MRQCGESNPSRRLWKVIVPTIVFLCAAVVVAEKPDPGPKYDKQTETKLKGTVDDVKLPPGGSQKLPVHLMVKSGEATVDIYVCPKSFLDDMGITFTKGEELAITGSKIKDGDTEMVLAREIVKGTDTIVLRDDKGKPVWI